MSKKVLRVPLVKLVSNLNKLLLSPPVASIPASPDTLVNGHHSGGNPLTTSLHGQIPSVRTELEKKFTGNVCVKNLSICSETNAQRSWIISVTQAQQ